MVYEPRPTDQRVRLKPFNTALCVPPLSHQPKLMLDQNETQRHTTGLQRDKTQVTRDENNQQQLQLQEESMLACISSGDVTDYRTLS